jgi:hypothetical protein
MRPMKRTVAILAAGGALVAAAPAQGAVVELGVTPEAPSVTCPENCNAVGRVTGYQVTQAGGRRNMFRATEAGRAVAFTLRLGDPSEAQIASFADIFGTRSSRARLSVLRPGARRVHRLIRQSEVFSLNRYFGTLATFALRRSLRVARGDVLALTIPTWAPAFSVGLGESEAWRSSRRRGTCGQLTRHAEMQRVGQRRTFGCTYRTARLRYSVTFVPNPKPKS